jgi:hypothetical protein
MLAATFAPYFRKEGKEHKGVWAGRPKRANNLDPNSGPDKKRNIKSKKANSTVGKAAAKAGVSIHKAEQAILIKENDPELSSAVEAGEMLLKDAAKEVASHIEKKANRKKIFNAGIKSQNTRNIRADVPVEKAVLTMFEGFIKGALFQHPTLGRDDIIGIVRNAINP